MTDNLAVFLSHQRDDAVAGFSKFFYELSLGQLAEGRRNDLVNSFPVVWAFFADVNHPHDLSMGRYGQQVMGLPGGEQFEDYLRAKEGAEKSLLLLKYSLSG